MGDYGGGASGSAAAAAELHLKMSKKIAQLTKVIFHLNTRNEDFQSEFVHLQHAHARSEQQLTQDAAAKLRALSEQLAAHKDAAARDKAQLLADLAAFQQQAARQQQAAQLEFQRRVAMLEEQVETARRAFVDRVQQLTRVAESQQAGAAASSGALQAAHRRELDALARAHSDELEQVVTSSNAKFTHMLSEQLRAQDALRAEMATQLATQRHEWEAAAQASADAQRLEWQQEREAAQQRFDETKQQLVGKMEVLLADAEALRAGETRLRAEKEALLATQSELQRTIQRLELEVRQAQHEAQSVRKDSEANAQKLLHAVATGAATSEQRARELEALKATLCERDAALALATKERDGLQLELLNGSASLSERNAQHTQQLSERDLKLANLQSELAKQRQAAAASEAASAQTVQALETRVAELIRARDELQSKLASAELLRASTLQDKDKAAQALRTKLEDADRTIATLRADHAARLQELKDAHAKAVGALRSDHDQQTETLQREAEKRVADAEARLSQDSSASLERALGELAQRHACELDTQRAAAAASEAQWTQRLAQLETQLKTAQSDLSASAQAAAETRAKIAELTAKLAELTAKLATSEAQLAQAKRDKEASGKTQKDRDEAFQRQLKELAAQHESALRRLAGEKDRLAADHARALAQLVKEHEAKLAAAQAAWDAHRAAELTSQQDTLAAGHTQQLAELHVQLAGERERAEHAALAAQDELAQLEAARAREVAALVAEMAQLKDEYEQQLAALSRSHEAATEAANTAHGEQLARLQSGHVNALEQLSTRATTAAESQKAQLEQQHAAALEALRTAHAAREDALQAQRNSEALALRAEMARKLKEQRAQADADHARATDGATARHDALLADWRAKHDALAAALGERDAQLSASQRACEALHEALERVKREAQDRVAALERANREELEKLKRAAKRDMDRLLEENLSEIRQLSEQFEETRRALCEHVDALQRAVDEWELRYARRESREEDVARIQALERAVGERDALVKRTLDEMAYFKRELLNREEMYNKTFARAPNVGVLNVLKPHVLLQAQMQQQQNNSVPQGIQPKAPPGSQQSSARHGSTVNGKPARAPQEPELQRRGSERGTPGAPGAKKALPPLGNNQAFGL